MLRQPDGLEGLSIDLKWEHTVQSISRNESVNNGNVNIQITILLMYGDLIPERKAGQIALLKIIRSFSMSFR